MADVMISYAREDRAVAERLAQALESRGWSVWWDRKIPAGKTFDEVLEEAIAVARCIVVLWSEKSVASRWVRSEAEEGAVRNILVPVLIEPMEIPLAFRRIQAADLIGWEGGSTGDSALESLIEDIALIVGRAPTEDRPETERAEGSAQTQPLRAMDVAEGRGRAGAGQSSQRTFGTSPRVLLAGVAAILALIVGTTMVLKVSRQPEPWVDAAFSLGNQSWLFQGNRYFRMTDKKLDAGYPKDLPGEGEWQGLSKDFRQGIDAALYFNKTVYLFRGANYVAYENSGGSFALIDGPQRIRDTWLGLHQSATPDSDFSQSIDAACLHKNGYVYFFKGSRYTAFDPETFKKLGEAYPADLCGGWCPEEYSAKEALRGFISAGIDAAMTEEGDVHPSPYFFFKGDRYFDYNGAWTAVTFPGGWKGLQEPT